MKNKNRIIAALSAIAITVSSFGLLLNMAAGTVNAATTYAGLGATKHTKAEIISYVKAHPWKSETATFTKNPSVTSPYSLGEVSSASTNNALNYLNCIRYIAGVGQVSLSSTSQEYAQAAALIQAINHSLDHYPTQPSGMSSDLYSKCYTGSSNSNLAGSGGNFVLDISRYMTEVNGDRVNFGHRRQLLDPSMTTTGFGYATSTTGGTYSATYVDANIKENIAVSYPAQYQPLEYFGTGYPWSVTIPQSFTASQVQVKLTNTKTGKVWNFSNSGTGYNYLAVSTNFGTSKCLIFQPEDILYRDGDVYQVEITGIPQPIKYTVNMFNIEYIPVENISLSQYTPSAAVGETVDSTTSVVVSPSNASNRIVNWTSSDPTIATVKTYGTSGYEITAIKEGTVTITGTSEDCGKKVSFQFTVIPPAKSIDCVSSITVGRGQEYRLTGKVLPAEARKYPTFFSKDTSIVKCEQKLYTSYYTVTGVKNGTTTITAMVPGTTVTKSITVNVVDPIYVSKIAVTGPDTAMLGDEVKFTAGLTPTNATVKDIEWSTSNINVLTNNGNGSFTAKGMGTCTITAKALDGSNTEAKVEVKVYSKAKTPSLATADSVTNTSITIKKVSGEGSSTTPVVYSLDGKTWQTSNVFTNLLPNTTYKVYKKIQAYNYVLESEISGPASISTSNLATSITINNTVTTATVGDTIVFSASVVPSNASNAQIVWSVSDTSIASIDSNTGSLKALKNGSVTVYAKLKDNSKTAYMTLKIYNTQEAPAAPLLGGVTHNSLWVTNDDTTGKSIEYSIDGVTWTSGNTFTGLQPETTYFVYARYRATSTSLASPKSAARVIITKPSPVYITSINSIVGPDTLMVGEIGKYSFTYSPSNANQLDVTWSSNSINSLTSLGDGSFKAAYPGSIVITVKSKKDTTITQTKTVKIYKKYDAPAELTFSSITNTSVALYKQRSDMVFSMDGKNWQTSNLFTGLNPATSYTFYAKIPSSGYYLESDVVSATTKTTNKISSIKITNASVEAVSGKPIKFEATFEPANATNPNIVWSVSNTSVGTIDSKTGSFVGTKYGYITVYAKSDDGSASASKSFYVKDFQAAPPAPEIVSVTSNSITIKPAINGDKYVYYSIDGTNWKRVSTFSGLLPNTEYVIYAKTFAGSTYAESPLSSTKVKTAALPTATPTNKPTATPTKRPTATPIPTVIVKPSATPIPDGLNKIDNQWKYYVGGRFQSTSSGIVRKANSTDTNWYYVENGIYKVASGIAQKADGSSSSWYYVKDGIYTKATGIAQKADKSSSSWYYVSNGVYTKATGIAQKADQSSLSWYYVANGVYNKATGIAQKADKSSSSWYYVKNGVYTKVTGVTFKADGSSGTGYYVRNGVYTQITLIAPMVDETVAKYYIDTGVWVKATGKVTIDGKTYTLKSGVVQ